MRMSCCLLTCSIALMAVDGASAGPEARKEAVSVCLDQGKERPLFRIEREANAYPAPTPRPWASGRSVGAPNAGNLLGGAPLPPSPLYRCRREATCVGSSHAIEALQRAIVSYHRRIENREPLIIGDISGQGGGALREHKSHQSGRDVDIAVPRRGVDGKSDGEIDWSALAHLVEALVEGGDVDVIFLDYGYQAHIVRASKSPHMPRLVQWRSGVALERRINAGLVRHAPGHQGHIHVRFRCGAGEAECQPHPIGSIYIDRASVHAMADDVATTSRPSGR